MLRWHYSQEEGRCIVFQYGGCGGNRNRFVNKNSTCNYCNAIIISLHLYLLFLILLLIVFSYLFRFLFAWLLFCFICVLFYYSRFTLLSASQCRKRYRNACRLIKMSSSVYFWYMAYSVWILKRYFTLNYRFLTADLCGKTCHRRERPSPSTSSVVTLSVSSTLTPSTTTEAETSDRPNGNVSQQIF